jgi:hypothetical protein
MVMVLGLLFLISTNDELIYKSEKLKFNSKSDTSVVIETFIKNLDNVNTDYFDLQTFNKTKAMYL